MAPKLFVNGRAVRSREPRPEAAFAGRSATEGLAGEERRLLSEGIDAFFRGDAAKAVESLLRVLNISYSNPEACLYMARLCRQRGGAGSAISYLTRAIDAGAVDSGLHMERGFATLEKRTGLWSDANSAMRDFATAFLLNSNEVRALYYMSVCKHRMRDYGDALALLERYVELAPVDLTAARELEIYRHKTRCFMHYSHMPLLYGSWKHN